MRTVAGTTDVVIDRDLIRAVQAGDRTALAKLYDRHAAQLLGVAYGILRDRHDAEDLLHDVFLEAWQRAQHYDPARGTVYTWLVLRLRSRAIDRARAFATARAHAMVSSHPDPIVMLSRDDPSQAPDRAWALQALACLPDTQRLAIELAYFEGLTYREIAARCAIPEGTVKSRLAAAVAKLRQALTPARGETDAAR